MYLCLPNYNKYEYLPMHIFNNKNCVATYSYLHKKMCIYIIHLHIFNKKMHVYHANIQKKNICIYVYLTTTNMNTYLCISSTQTLCSGCHSKLILSNDLLLCIKLLDTIQFIPKDNIINTSWDNC